MQRNQRSDRIRLAFWSLEVTIIECASEKVCLTVRFGTWKGCPFGGMVDVALFLLYEKKDLKGSG